MTLHIDELTSRVEAERAPAPESTASAPPDPWDSVHHLRDARARIAEIDWRTRAEGHDD